MSKNNPIMQKSLTYYNFLAEKKKQDIEANIKWAKSKETIPLPKYHKEKIPELNAGIFNFINNIFKKLRP